MASEDIRKELVKVRHDWYQSETHVVIVLLQKNIQSDQLRIDCTSRRLEVELGPDTKAVFNLAHDVKPDSLTKKLTAAKLEIKIPKLDGIQWRELEGDEVIPAIPAPKVPEKGKSSQTKNWDAVVKDEEVDEADPLNTLFRKIYTEGSDEVRKAMNKSFMESGGTVLSTNWGQVKESPVDIKPPDGTEFKKWD